jgi:hypothetical protein
MFQAIKSFFTGGDVKSLQNKLAHFVIEHQRARTKISDAKKAFERVRENTVKDFQKLKECTITKTVNSVARLMDEAKEEEKVVTSKYEVAKSKIEDKVASLITLNSTVQQIGGKEYPLE